MCQDLDTMGPRSWLSEGDDNEALGRIEVKTSTILNVAALSWCRGLAPMIGVAGKDSRGPVDLLGKHDAGKPMGKDHGAE